MADDASLGTTLHATAVRSLEAQERRVTEIRNRTGPVLAVAALSASVFGARALERVPLSGWVVLALAILALVLAANLFVAYPHDVAFALDVRVLHAELQADSENRELVQLRLAYALRDMRQENEPVVDRLYKVFAAGLVLLVLDILLWGIALVVR
jgi:hypothetical protein